MSIPDLRIFGNALAAKLRRPLLGHDMIAVSPAMRSVVQRAERFATADATVLLLGESGTGKEVITQYIHQNSPRANSPLVRINCAAIPEGLMESELFGHARGAFTSADKDRVGRLEHAGEGTVLLDEVGELPLSIQAKLLRVLEEGEFQRVGSNEVVPLKARFIAATNRDLKAEVATRQFRADLYYRLNVLHLSLPALRDRVEDLQPLAESFLRTFSGGDELALTRCAIQQIHDYDWPGNVRELRNAIHRAVVLNDGTQIERLELDRTGAANGLASAGPPSSGWPAMSLADAEQRTLEAAIAQTGGNQTAAAEILGVTPRTVANMLRRYGKAS